MTLFGKMYRSVSKSVSNVNERLEFSNILTALKTESLILDFASIVHIASLLHVYLPAVNLCLL